MNRTASVIAGIYFLMPDLGSNWVAAGVVVAATAVVYGVVVLVGRLF